MAELEGPAHVIQPLDERDPLKADSGILDVLLLAGSSCQRNLLTSRWLLGGRGYYYPLQCAASWKIASDGIILGLAWLEGKVILCGAGQRLLGSNSLRPVVFPSAAERDVGRGF